MPKGDQTGPAGAGPMTGRGTGVCVATTAGLLDELMKENR